MIDLGHRYLIKCHEDILTVPEAINELYMEYKNLGYDMMRKVMNSFSYRLDDGTVIIVYWEKGFIYEKVVVITGNM